MEKHVQGKMVHAVGMAPAQLAHQNVHAILVGRDMIVVNQSVSMIVQVRLFKGKDMI